MQGVGVQRAKAFVHKQGIHADAAGTFLDGIADAKSQAERRQKAFAAGKGADRAGLAGVGIEHIQLQCGLGGNIGALAAAQGILAARHAGKTTVGGGDHAVKIKALHILFKGQLLLLGQVAVDGLAQVIQHGSVGAGRFCGGDGFFQVGQGIAVGIQPVQGGLVLVAQVFALSLQCSKGLLLGGRVRAAGGIPGLFGQGLGGALGRSKFFGKSIAAFGGGIQCGLQGAALFLGLGAGGGHSGGIWPGQIFLPLGKAGLGFRGGFFGVGLCGAGLLHSVCLVGALGLQLGFLAGQLFQIFFAGFSICHAVTHFGKAAAQAVMLGLQGGLQLVRGQGIGLRPGIMLAAARQKGGGTRIQVFLLGLGCGFGFPGCGGGFGSFRRSARRCLRSFVAGGFGDMAGGGSCRCRVVQSTAHRAGGAIHQILRQNPGAGGVQGALHLGAGMLGGIGLLLLLPVFIGSALPVGLRGVQAGDIFQQGLAVLLLALGQLNGFAAAFQLGVRFAAGRDLRFQLG